MSFVDFRHGSLEYRLTDVLVCQRGVMLPELTAAQATAVLRAALGGALPVLATRVRGVFSDIDGGRAKAPILQPFELADRIGDRIERGRMTLIAYEPVTEIVDRVDDPPVVPPYAPTVLERAERVVTGLIDVPAAEFGDDAVESFLELKKALTESPALIVTMVVVFAGWIASQAAPPVGLVIDAALLGFAIYSLGMQAFDWFERLAGLVGDIASAKTDADFRACSSLLAKLIVQIGLAVFISLLLRAAGRKISKSSAKKEPELRTAPPKALPPKPAPPPPPPPPPPKPAIPLNPGIKLTPKGMKHVTDRHTDSGIAKFAAKSKFDKGEDLEALIKQTTQHPMAQQANGNFTRTVDMGRSIGIDRATGQPTNIMTVVTKPDGTLVTAFPGYP